MKVCVLQPDYTGSSVDYQKYDPPRDLAPLLPDCQVDHLFLRKATTYRQLREAAARGYDIYVNLCEGYLDWDVPSVDVIWSLESLGLAYTGPGLRLYDPSKPLMKYVAHTQGVAFPVFVEAASEEDCATAWSRLRPPLFVKPAHAGDSLGIDARSRVDRVEDLLPQCGRVLAEYGRVLIEEFIAGREFTVLVTADPCDRFRPKVYGPIEFVFPEGAEFKTYDLKITQHHPECNVPVEDAGLDEKLRDAASRIFVGFEGEGYARLDFRMNAAGEIYFLDINFACSVFYQPGYEGSADYILKLDAEGQAGFLRHIIAEGMARRRRREPAYERREHGVYGFGIHARRAIGAAEVVFRGEERAQRLATLSHVERTWPEQQVEVFRHYSIPAGGGVRMLWDEDPELWSPQNHSCDPNTAYVGLNLVALRRIEAGEELTLDYESVYDEMLRPFECHCGSAKCRGVVQGRPGNGLANAGPSAGK